MVVNLETKLCKRSAQKKGLLKCVQEVCEVKPWVFSCAFEKLFLLSVFLTVYPPQNIFTSVKTRAQEGFIIRFFILPL